MNLLEKARQFVADFPESGFARLSLFAEEKRQERLEKERAKGSNLSLGWKVSEVIGTAVVNVPPKYPMYDQPRQVEWSEMACPVCYEERCYITSASQTLMGGASPEGHDHDPNMVTVHVACPNDHEFVYTRMNPCPACEYGHILPRITEVEGRRQDRWSEKNIYTLGDKRPKEVVPGVIGFVGEPEFVGQMPPRRDIEIIPADEFHGKLNER